MFCVFLIYLFYDLCFFVFRYPLKVTKAMGKKRATQRSKIKPFIKVINYSHLMPTRYVGVKKSSLYLYIFFWYN